MSSLWLSQSLFGNPQKQVCRAWVLQCTDLSRRHGMLCIKKWCCLHCLKEWTLRPLALLETGGKFWESAFGTCRWPSSWIHCLLVIKGLKWLSKQWMTHFHLYLATSKAPALPLKQTRWCKELLLIERKVTTWLANQFQIGSAVNKWQLVYFLLPQNTIWFDCREAVAFSVVSGYILSIEDNRERVESWKMLKYYDFFMLKLNIFNTKRLNGIWNPTEWFKLAE